jgi:hypothetical protein
MRRITFLLSVILLLLAQASIASAQIQIGTVKGSVSDPANALLAGAEVTLDNSITGFHAATRTAGSGEFIFDNVPFGNYTLRPPLSFGWMSAAARAKRRQVAALQGVDALHYLFTIAGCFIPTARTPLMRPLPFRRGVVC